MPVIRIYIFSLIIILIPANAVSQSDTTKTATEKEHNTLYAGAGYGSNMIYLGSTISRNMSFGYGAVSYSPNDELFLTGAAFYLPGLDISSPSFYSAALTYNHTFNSWFDISAGLYRYMVKPALTDSLFSNFNYADVTLGFDWRILYTEISYGTFIMPDPPAYFQVKNSRYFETHSFLKGKANISFTPYINVLFGDMIITEIMEGTELITTIQTVVTPVTTTSTQGNSSEQQPDTGSRQGAGSGQSSGSSTSTTTTTTTTVTGSTTIPTTTTTYSEKFNLIDTEFGLPVSLNLGQMSFEAEVSYILPMYANTDSQGTKGFVFMFSAFFKIF